MGIDEIFQSLGPKACPLKLDQALNGPTQPRKNWKKIIILFCFKSLNVQIYSVRDSYINNRKIL